MLYPSVSIPTFLPDNIVPQRVGQFHSLPVVRGGSPQLSWYTQILALGVSLLLFICRSAQRDTDLAVLLMNLLENTVEANQLTLERAGKWMRATMHIRRQYLYAGIENALFAAVEQGEYLFRSTTGDGRHGTA